VELTQVPEVVDFVGELTDDGVAQVGSANAKKRNSGLIKITTVMQAGPGASTSTRRNRTYWSS
jgi:hypothetical protein